MGSSTACRVHLDVQALVEPQLLALNAIVATLPHFTSLQFAQLAMLGKHPPSHRRQYQPFQRHMMAREGIVWRAILVARFVSTAVPEEGQNLQGRRCANLVV